MFSFLLSCLVRNLINSTLDDSCCSEKIVDSANLNLVSLAAAGNHANLLVLNLSTVAHRRAKLLWFRSWYVRDIIRSSHFIYRTSFGLQYLKSSETKTPRLIFRVTHLCDPWFRAYQWVSKHVAHIKLITYQFMLAPSFVPISHNCSNRCWRNDRFWSDRCLWTQTTTWLANLHGLRSTKQLGSESLQAFQFRMGSEEDVLPFSWSMLLAKQTCTWVWFWFIPRAGFLQSSNNNCL